MGSVQGGAIVKAIVALAKGLSLKVVAEGVETEDQVACLSDLYCDYFQGYYFSRPLPQEEIESELKEKFGLKSS